MFRKTLQLIKMCWVTDYHRHNCLFTFNKKGVFVELLGIPDFGHGHIGHPVSGHLTSDIWTYDTREERRTLGTWTLDTCIFIFQHAYEHRTRSNYNA